MTDVAVTRQPSGRWVKGTASPNPHGRRSLDVTVEALAKSYSCDAVRRLALLGGIYRDVNGKLLPGARSETTQVHALNALLNRAHGLPRQQIETNDSASPILMHLLAAQAASAGIIERLEKHTVINGHVEPAAEPPVVDLNAPPPTE